MAKALLLSTKNAKEVERLMRANGIKIGHQQILGVANYEHISLNAPHAGRKHTEEAKQKMTGRPPGPGKPRSEWRARARELHARHPDWSNQAIADTLTDEAAKTDEPRTFTREGVRYLLKQDDSSAGK